MRVWATLRRKDKIINEEILDLAYTLPLETVEWVCVISEACQKLDIERPVVLHNHIRDLNEFSHTGFSVADFMDEIAFERFSIEVFPEKK